jgi:hypothetical protein
MVTAYRGGCHCGRVRLEVTGELTVATECNCSICLKSGYLHWYVEPQQVRLLTQKQLLSTYVWRSITGGHHFCPVCGIAVIRMSVQYPPPLSINVRCLEGVDLAELRVEHFDGRRLIP